MNALITLNNKTAGRDKQARLLQYACKLLWDMMQRMNADRKNVETFQSLESIFSNFRKLLRMGRFIDALHSARFLLNHEDLLVKFNCAFAKIAYALYLFCDHLIWLGSAGILDVNLDRWKRTANKYWLFTIVLNLIRDYVEIKRIYEVRKSSKKYGRGGASSTGPVTAKTVAACVSKSLNLALEYKDVTVDAVKNGCDILIPLAALNYVKASPGVVGLMGVISSSVAIYSLVVPMAKLPMT